MGTVLVLQGLTALGVLGAVILYVLAYWDRGVEQLGQRTKRFQSDSEIAGVAFNPKTFAVQMIFGATLAWLVLILVLKPPILVAVLAAPALLALAFGCVKFRIDRALKKRRALFVDQLEMLLRLISGGMRAGLGLQQALVSVTSELPSPAHEEVVRVLGQASIGVSIYDALDELANRMPSQEMTIISKTIRAQSQTGGDLAKILDKLANTIRERRRLFMKIRTMTSEGRASAWVVGAIPPALGGTICLINPHMAHTLIGTSGGIAAGVLMVIFESACAFVLMQMLKFDF
jgi:tight adherence protein B